MSELTRRFDSVCARLAAAAATHGRGKGAVRLVAVSKWHGAQSVAELAQHWQAKAQAEETGGPIFGESYMQEARAKIPEVADITGGFAPEWHFIGHLQSRKAKDVVGCYSLIHSLDSEKLAKTLDRAWREREAGRPVGLSDTAPGPQPVLIQVNVGREEQKSGVMPERLDALVESVLSLEGLDLQGLMCIPPLAEIGAESRRYFVLLRELRDAAEARFGIRLPHLSMGMSDDFEDAVAEGATLVRIGTDIFGPRAY